MDATRKCVGCGETIVRNPSWAFSQYEKRRYCNQQCKAAARPDIERDYIVTESGCWEWQGRLDRNGYGKAYDATRPAGQRVDWAHRVSYRRHVGPIADGYQLDHTCENTVCINPAHLDQVTVVEHVRRTFMRLGKDDRDTYAARLRTSGLTYQQIADVLSLSSKTSAHGAVQAAVRKGLVDPDSVPPTRRLDEQDYEDIRDLYLLGVPQRELAAWYGIDDSQASRICNGKTSGHAVAA